MGKWRWWQVAALVAVVVGVRLIKIDTNSHFVTDESRDLVHIHQIFVERKLTLVGPISEDRSHVFSSLTYYMLLPFAALGNFDPLAPVIGMVAWGSITALLLVWAIYQINPRLGWPAALGVAIWWPLVQTSRWAWNPNLVTFWLVLGWVAGREKVWWRQMMSGLCMGLAVHHHYLALLPIAIYVIYNRSVAHLMGLMVAWLPFVIFDLRHPPGLFVLRNLLYIKDAQNKSLGMLSQAMWNSQKLLVEYFVAKGTLGKIANFCLIALVVWDVRNIKRAAYKILLWLVLIVGPAWLSLQFHYLLPAAIFFCMWLAQPRRGWGKVLAIVIVVLATWGSAARLKEDLFSQSWISNIRSIRMVTQILTEQIEKQKLINANIVVLVSPDNYTNGNKYRDLLLVRNIRLRLPSEYELSDNLFVVTQGSEDQVRKDPAVEMEGFRRGPVFGQWSVPESDWRVIQFNKY